MIGDKYHDVLTAPGGLSHTADGMAEGPLPLIFMYLGRPVAGTVSPLDAMVIENLRNAGIKVGPSTEGVLSVSLMVAGDMQCRKPLSGCAPAGRHSF